MKRPTIWLNSGLPETVFLVRALQAVQVPDDRFRIIATHRRARRGTALGAVCEFEEEPLLADRDAYVSWCLKFACDRAVDVFIPHRHAYALAGVQDKFRELGCRLIVAGTQETLALVNNKVALYEAVRACSALTVPIPPFRVARGLEEFEAACQELAADYPVLAVKPTVGLGAQGFRVISEKPLSASVNGDLPPMTLSETVAYLRRRQGGFGELMVMPYMSGPETSVDCLAEAGRLIASVVRTKFPSGEGLIEERSDLVACCAQLTGQLKLNGLFNVQFLESADGRPQLLEVNARLAGGTFFGAFSGLLVPYWAIRLALGTATEADIPRPKTGIRFDRLNRVVLSDGTPPGVPASFQ